MPRNCIIKGTVTLFKNVGYLPIERRSEKYGETLSDDSVGLTENPAEMMHQFFELKLQEKNK